MPRVIASSRARPEAGPPVGVQVGAVLGHPLVQVASGRASSAPARPRLDRGRTTPLGPHPVDVAPAPSGRSGRRGRGAGHPATAAPARCTRNARLATAPGRSGARGRGCRARRRAPEPSPLSHIAALNVRDVHDRDVAPVGHVVPPAADVAVGVRCARRRRRARHGRPRRPVHGPQQFGLVRAAAAPRRPAPDLPRDRRSPPVSPPVTPDGQAHVVARGPEPVGTAVGHHRDHGRRARPVRRRRSSMSRARARREPSCGHRRPRRGGPVGRPVAGWWWREVVGVGGGHLGRGHRRQARVPGHRAGARPECPRTARPGRRARRRARPTARQTSNGTTGANRETTGVPTAAARRAGPVLPVTRHPRRAGEHGGQLGEGRSARRGRTGAGRRRPTTRRGELLLGRAGRWTRRGGPARAARPPPATCARRGCPGRHRRGAGMHADVAAAAPPRGAGTGEAAGRAA